MNFKKLNKKLLLIVVSVITLSIYLLMQNNLTNNNLISELEETPIKTETVEIENVAIVPNEMTANEDNNNVGQEEVKEYVEYGVDAFISKFYKDIENKNYEAAYQVAPLGRTLEDFIELYSPIEKVFFILNKGSLLTDGVWVGMQPYQGSMTFYNVKMKIEKKNEQLEIVEVQSIPYSAPFDLECYTNSPESVYPQDRCNLINIQHNKVIHLTDPSISSMLFKEKSENDITYYSLSDYFNTSKKIFSYDSVTKSFSYIETLKLNYYPTHDHIFTEFFSDCERPNYFFVYTYMATRETYNQPCMDKYRNEEWFKQNLKTVENFGKYSDLKW